MPRIYFSLGEPYDYSNVPDIIEKINVSQQVGGSRGTIETFDSNTYISVSSDYFVFIAVKPEYKVVSAEHESSNQFKQYILYDGTHSRTGSDNTYINDSSSGSSVWDSSVGDVNIKINVEPIASESEPEPEIVTETETVTETVPYETIENENPSMLIGETEIVQNGVDGERTITYEVSYVDNGETDRYGRPILEEINRVEISNEITTEPINKIIEVGTKEPQVMRTIEINGENATVELENTETNEIFNVQLNEPTQIPESNYNIKIIADDGYFFTRFTKINRHGLEDDITIDDGATEIIYNIDIYSSEDFKVYTDVVDIPQPDTTGFNHLYLMNNEQLKSFTNERLTIPSGEPGVEGTDISSNIINILELPFKLNESFLRTEKNIVLGTENLNTKGMQLIGDEYVIEFDDITVSGKYNNSFDYINTNIRIHLPFTNTIEIEPEYVINETLSITYIVDLYSGDTDINIRSSKINNEIVENLKIKIGRNIPFVRDNGNVLISPSDRNGINNNVYSPFIEVIRNKPIEMNSNINERGVIGNYTGYIVVDRPEIEVDSTLSEKNEIEILLNQGVYING